MQANPGNICFLYGEETAYGILYVKKSLLLAVNTLMIFPANLRHHVMHFNSKGTRTSVAGNIKFEWDKL